MGHPKKNNAGGNKKSHVVTNALMEYAKPPDASKGEYICRALGSRGSNKIDVELPDDGHHALVILPAKFHKTIWVGKGTFVIVRASEDRIEEDGARFFNGEIVRVLMKDDEKYLKGLDSVWPERFQSSRLHSSIDRLKSDGEDDDKKKDDKDKEQGGPADRTTTSSSSSSSSSSEDDMPEYLQRVQNRKIIHYNVDDDDDSSEDDDA